MVTVIIPTHNHEILLEFAVDSVLNQTEQDFEIFIVGDGSTQKTKESAIKKVGIDPRVRYLEFKKAGRTGEPHRHEIITKHATGEFIFYLSDDDIWLNNHLESMLSELTKGFNFCHSPFVAAKYLNVDFDNIKGTKDANDIAADLLDPKNYNFIPLSCCGHRKDFYMKLPEGWTITPSRNYTDHYMWKKMAAHPQFKASNYNHATVVNFPSIDRTKLSMKQRVKEMSAWILAKNDI